MDPLFVVLWEDRHADPEITIFTEISRAVEYVKTGLTELGRWPHDVEMETENPRWPENLLARYSYSPEGDQVTIQKITPNEK